MAHVRHRQGVGLARRPGFDRISVPQRACRGLSNSNIGACRSRAPRTEDLSAPLRRHDHRLRQGPPAQRTCAAADRTGHAMLHTLYGQALRAHAEFFIEYFAIDLIMERTALPRRRLPEARRRHDPPLPRAARDPGDRRLWPRLFLLPPPRIPAPATAMPWCCAPACRCRIWNSCSSIRPASTAPAASSPRARAAKAAISPIPRASASWSAMRLPRRTSPRATWSRAP